MKKVINLQPKLATCSAAIILIAAVTISAYNISEYIGLL